jgi:hypothetical protein
MIDDKIDDTLVALSRAFSLETHEVYRKAILRLIEERYPDSLYVHFCRAELNPGDELKVQSLMQAVRQRQGEIDPARVAQRPVNCVYGAQVWGLFGAIG